MPILKPDKIIYAFLIIELLSLLSFFNDWVQPFVFFPLLFLFLWISLKNLEYGILIIFSEIIIGSFGYLFWLDIFGFRLSIRIAFWLIFFSIWLGKLIIRSRQAQSLVLPVSRNSWRHALDPKNNNLAWPYYSLLFFTATGLLVGIINQNGIKNIFFDFNAWISFLLFIPLLDVSLADQDFFNRLKSTIWLSAIWVTAKTFFLLYYFSHNFLSAQEMYRFVRDTRFAEVTRLNGDYFRVFSQTHIYVLLAFFIALTRYFRQAGSGKKLFFAVTAFMAINLLNFSRSNWVGLAFGLLAYLCFVVFIFKPRLISILKELSAFIGIIVLSLILVAVIVRFPLPDPRANINPADLLAKRAQEFSNEAGVSSRWKLLPVLVRELKGHAIIGAGFGRSIEYISDDPRIRAQNSEGLYRTYAFEWGWLDIWLKIGLFGLISYLGLIFVILKNCYTNIKKTANLFDFGLFLGLVALFFVNIFSPYLNHPLGISLVILAGVLSRQKK